MFDGEAFGAEIVATVKSHVANSVAPLLKRIDDLEAEIKILIARPLIPGPPGEAGKDGESIIGPPGNDGVGIASTFIDREGNLVLTFTDGTVGSVGKVVGTDGASGKDGEKGKDGRDGLGFDDIQVTMLEDGHTIEIKFVREGITKAFPIVFPNTKYCEIWRSENSYMRGDIVTYGGSGWVAKENSTGDKPGDGSKAWQLFTKKGRDGRDGKDGRDGPQGKEGPRGRDLTQMDFNGNKF